jgi:hypothetical protein
MAWNRKKLRFVFPRHRQMNLYRYGDFRSDSRKAKYNMTWSSWRAFELSLRDTQTREAVEFLHPKRKDCKIGSTLTECAASLTVKAYQDTETVLGIHDEKHNHPITFGTLEYQWENETMDRGHATTWR